MVLYITQSIGLTFEDTQLQHYVQSSDSDQTDCTGFDIRVSLTHHSKRLYEIQFREQPPDDNSQMYKERQKWLSGHRVDPCKPQLRRSLRQEKYYFSRYTPFPPIKFETS